MILVDTSVWIDHLRHGVAALAALLDQGQVLMHPLILGELACGNLRNRAEVLKLLGRLPPAPTVSNDEVLAFIERRGLMARGIGIVDVHLLASATLAPDRAAVWTQDHRLHDAAASLHLAYSGK